MIKQNYWIINGVNYRDTIQSYDLLKTPLGNRNGTRKKYSQNELILLSKQAKKEGDFYGADAPLHHAIFTALSEQNTEDAKEARRFIKNWTRRGLITLTRIVYNPKGKDEIIHNIGMDNEYKIHENVVDGSVHVGYRKLETERRQKRQGLIALLGTNDPERKIGQTYSQFTIGKEPDFVMFGRNKDNRLKIPEELVVSLSCGRRFCFNCNTTDPNGFWGKNTFFFSEYNIVDKDYALGVRLHS